MPFLPSGNTDPFNAAQASGFVASDVPSQTGLGTRTGRLPTNRPAVMGRKMITWLVPEGPVVEMYINPQSIKYDDTKGIEPQRTKGGFVIQYWGENLQTLSISGTTGTSGIEGINVLRDIYRNEQLAFDPYALFLAAKQRQEVSSGDIFGINSAIFESDPLGAIGANFIESLSGATSQAFPAAVQQPPTLASLACQVEMYWSGEVYRGFFNSFSVDERANNLGMFDYSIRFTVTQKRGFRQNFLGWHRSPVHGPSNSDPQFGTPYSFGQLVGGDIVPPKVQEQPDILPEYLSYAKTF